MKKAWKTTKGKRLIAISLAGIMAWSVPAVAAPAPITAAAADAEKERVYAGTVHTPKESAYRYDPYTGSSDYCIILYPGEQLGWEGNNPNIGYGEEGGLGCNDAKEYTPKSTQQRYTYKYGVKLASPSDETEYTEGSKTVDWIKGEGAASQESGEKTLTFHDTIRVKDDAKGPVRLKYKGNPDRDYCELKCSEGTHVLKTYTSYTGYEFEAESLSGNSFSVRYDLDGGVIPSGETYPTDFYFSDTAYTTDELKPPVKLGYKFASWKIEGTDLDFLCWSKNKFTVNALETNNYVWNDAKDLAANGAVLTANWRDTTVSVVFSYNGGTYYNSVTGEAEDREWEQVSLSFDGDFAVDPYDKEYYWFQDYTTRLLKDGYLFDGWYIGDTRITCFGDIPASVWNADQRYTLTAHWKEDPKHEHTYAAAWSSDADNHWHAASCAHTTEVKDKAAHSFKEVIDKQATETAEGSKHEACTVCGYQKPAVVIPKLEKAEEPKKPEEPTPTPQPKPKQNAKPVQTEDKNQVTTTAKGEATITEFKKTTGKSVKVASTVTLDGYRYTVTTIGANAFKNASKAKTVTLPDTVVKIKASAFAKSKITTVKITVKKGAKLSVDRKAFKKSNVKKIQITVSKKATAKEKNAIIKAFTKAGIKKANIKLKKSKK